jgi:uncharacterized membrane protein
VAAGAVAAVLAGLMWNWAYAAPVGWDVAAVVYTGLVWGGTWRLNGQETAECATAEDPKRAMSDILTLSASVASLVGVGTILVSTHSAHGAAVEGLAGFGLLSVAISWFTVHTVFALRYALLYYTEPIGGVNFHQDERPSFQDFAYLALTVGMTFQVADTDLGSTALRATVLRHALLSYLFGAVILAGTINLIAGLGSSGSIK